MNKLKELRKNLGITQTDIAKELGIDRTSYCKYETGEVKLPIDILIKLANYFKTTTDYILERESEIIDLNSYPNYKKELIKIVIKLSQEQCNQTNCFFKGLVPNICQQLAEETHNKNLESEAVFSAIKDAEILNNLNQNKGIK